MTVVEIILRLFCLQTSRSFHRRNMTSEVELLSPAKHPSCLLYTSTKKRRLWASVLSGRRRFRRHGSGRTACRRDGHEPRVAGYGAACTCLLYTSGCAGTMRRNRWKADGTDAGSMNCILSRWIRRRLFMELRPHSLRESALSPLRTRRKTSVLPCG